MTFSSHGSVKALKWPHVTSINFWPRMTFWLQATFWPQMTSAELDLQSFGSIHSNQQQQKLWWQRIQGTIKYPFYWVNRLISGFSWWLILGDSWWMTHNFKSVTSTSCAVLATRGASRVSSRGTICGVFIALTHKKLKPKKLISNKNQNQKNSQI